MITTETKSQQRKICSTFLKFMKRPETKFCADTISNCELIRSK